MTAVPMRTELLPTPAALYCRQARWLRATLSDRPAELQQALTVLGREQVAPQKVVVHPIAPRPAVVVRRLSASTPYDPVPGMSAVERAFASRIVDRMATAAVFTGSDRAALLRLAGRLGVSRFRANLLIAMHQHAAGPSATPSVDRPSRAFPYAAVAAAVVAVEVVTVVILLMRI